MDRLGAVRQVPKQKLAPLIWPILRHNTIGLKRPGLAALSLLSWRPGRPRGYEGAASIAVRASRMVALEMLKKPP